ncbi:MAG: PD-(D/E)XK nuclease domain-containing protein [Desulfamplus sp.]|nr:PD-(D/E)XK nuclease domain-containing protein [Desulfamplus sp.]
MTEIDTQALLNRYKAYLQRLKAKGINPWKDQPRRSDMHYTEYVGHFHLYFWLCQALDGICVVSPEFPTGNGRVDLMLRCKDRQAIIEVKSFRSQTKLEQAKQQALHYAKKLGLKATTLALFVPVEDEETLGKLSSRGIVEGVLLHVTAIGWV